MTDPHEPDPTVIAWAKAADERDRLRAREAKLLVALKRIGGLTEGHEQFEEPLRIIGRIRQITRKALGEAPDGE